MFMVIILTCLLMCLKFVRFCAVSSLLETFTVHQHSTVCPGHFIGSLF